MRRNNTTTTRTRTPLVLAVAVLGLVAGQATGRAAAEAGCDTTFVTVSVTDAAGNPPPVPPQSSTVDSRDPGRVVGLETAGPYHHLRPAGTVRRDGLAAFSYLRGGVLVAQQRYRADPRGTVTAPPADASALAAPGDTVEVLAQWETLACGVSTVTLGTVVFT